MRNEYNPRRWQQSSWPGYDQRDDGWSDNRSERWAQDDWMAESEGSDWESARRRSALNPWQLSEGGPSREALRYGSETEGSRASSGSSYPRGDDARRYEREYDRGWDVWSGAGREAGYGQRTRGTGDDDNWSGSGGYGSYGNYGRQGAGYRGSTDTSSDPYRNPARQPYRGASAAEDTGAYGRGGGYGGGFGEDEWSGRASRYGNAASGYDYAREYDDDGREHGPLYRLGRRIGEAVENLFGDDDEDQREREDYPRTGPKGYRRSDERIREAVCERLAYAEGIDVSDVSIDVDDGVVKLTGTVAHRRQKYDIEDMVEREFGVTDVQNEIRVRRNPRTHTSEEMTDVRNWDSDWT